MVPLLVFECVVRAVEVGRSRSLCSSSFGPLAPPVDAALLLASPRAHLQRCGARWGDPSVPMNDCAFMAAQAAMPPQRSWRRIRLSLPADADRRPDGLRIATRRVRLRR